MECGWQITSVTGVHFVTVYECEEFEIVLLKQLRYYQRRWRVLHWTVSLHSHSCSPTSFRPNHHVALCWIIECIFIWDWFQQADEYTWPHSSQPIFLVVNERAVLLILKVLLAGIHQSFVPLPVGLDLWAKAGWGCSSVGRASDGHTANAGSIPQYGKDFFFPRVKCYCRFSDGVRISPCATACINICAHVKDPVVHARVRRIVETLKQTAYTVGWVARLCRSWLSYGKAARISYGVNPNRKWRSLLELLTRSVIRDVLIDLYCFDDWHPGTPFD